MKLYDSHDGWTMQSMRLATPSVTLRSGVSRSLPALAYWRETLKLQARGLRHREHTRRWLQLLNSHPAFSDFVGQRPRLLYKIYRPYLTKGLDMDQRLALIASHYRFIFQRGLAPIVGQAMRAGVALAQIEGKNGETYQITLRAVEPLEREGELVLELSHEGKMVYATAFTFSDLDGCKAVSIGCIQGPKHGDGLEAIRNATRALHGLRPKQLLVTLVQQLGVAMGCRELRLVGNANRVVASALRQGRVCADYDQLWVEMGAQQSAGGDYLLPCAPMTAPDLEALASKKRSAARKRHQLALETAECVARSLGAPLPELLRLAA